MKKAMQHLACRGLLAGSVYLATAGLVSAESVTVVSFGGSWQDAQREALYKPTAEQLGITLLEDQLTGITDVRLQVQSGSVTWDVVDYALMFCQGDDAADLYEEIDYDLVPNAADLPENMKGKYWVGGSVSFSYVMAWRTDKYGNEPQKWSDFFDLEKFPGTRALYNQPRFVLELALIADGVEPDKLYPLDVDRAIAKLDSFKDNVTVFYSSHGTAAQMLRDGEIDMMLIANGRVGDLIRDGVPVTYTFNEGFLDADCLAVPKGAPNKEGAMKVINAFISPEIQANIPSVFDYGPVNPKAYDTGKITPERAAELPSSPNNAAMQTVFDARWWAVNQQEVQKKWDDFLNR